MFKSMPQPAPPPGGESLVTHQSSHAASVDGFIGVPWGATQQQIDNAMREKGFSHHEFMPYYVGSFAGYPAPAVSFQVRHNAFYEGQASICHTSENSGYREVEECSQKIVSMISDKYGQPTSRRSTHSNAFFLYWEGLHDAVSSDNITIKVWTSMPDSLNGGIVQVTYTNNSLFERLKGTDKGDI